MVGLKAGRSRKEWR